MIISIERVWEMTRKTKVALILIAIGLAVNLFLNWHYVVGPVRNNRYEQDEYMQQQVAVAHIRNIKTWTQKSLKEFVADIHVPHHPPARYFGSVLGIVIFGNTPFGLRAFALVGHIAMILIAAWFAFRLTKNWSSAVLTVWILSLSNISYWTLKAFGWGWLASFMMLATMIFSHADLDLRKSGATKDYILIQIFLCAAFLINMGAAIFIAVVHLYYLACSWRKPQRILAYGALTAVAYCIYLSMMFWILPAWTGWYSGTLLHIQQRLGSAATQTHPRDTILQLMTVYGYTWPIIVLLSIVAGVRNYRREMCLIGSYGLCWAFLMSGMTGQYVILAVGMCVPIASWTLIQGMRGRV